MPKAVAPKKKAAKGYALAESLPVGEVLQDISKNQWKLGPVVGHGGFGAIYSARPAADNGTKYPYVVKIEPHSNGPLFVEMHFYMRNAKQVDVEDFKKKMGLKTLGMPIYIGSGSHEYRGDKYRFIVMEQFGKDLWKTFLENKRVFPASTVFKISLQMLDVLEYIHSKGFVHADLKGANILMGVTKETANKQMYLIDFGLATKYYDQADFKPNPKKAHDGTIEYLSRDAHQGVQTRRGDLEILAYNIIQWLGCTLPWEKNLKDPNNVHKSKEEYMSDIPKFMKTCFTSGSPPAPLVTFLKYLLTLKHNSSPDYKKIRSILSSGLDKGDSVGKPFNFSVSKASNKTPSKTPTKRKGKGISIVTSKRRSARNNADSTLEEETVDEEEDSSGDILEEVNSKKTSSKKTSSKAATKRKGQGVSAVSPKRRYARNGDGDSTLDEEENVDEEEDSSGDIIEDSFIEDSKKTTSKKLPSKSPTKRNGRGVTSRKRYDADSTLEADDHVDEEEDSQDDWAEELDSSVNKVSSKKSPSKKYPKKTVPKSPTNKKTNGISEVLPRKRSTRSEDLDSTLEEKENWDEDESSTEDDVEEFISPSKPRRKITSPVSRKTKPIRKKPTTSSSNKKTISNGIPGETNAMREIRQRILERENSKKKTKARQPTTNGDTGVYNDAMKEVALMTGGRRKVIN
uniref:non-specific serine/threonine protein kinase n=1 Tax=Diabrotica virgifera virgifera TaxID=50390 RepID=A0A6P7FIL7_DIAVI